MLLSAIKTKCKKLSFTLAEVLITLTIIGVIAAITIPNLMQSWRKHERITQIKTAYSIIQNAVKMSTTENGHTSEWVFGWDNEMGANRYVYFFKKYIEPYLKIESLCFSNNGLVTSNKCLVNGNKYYTLTKTLEGDGVGIILENGMHMSVENNIANGSMRFVVDVNGKQGPTMLGNDVFMFEISLSNGNVRPFLWLHLQDNFNNIMTSNQRYACNTNALSAAGGSCARALEYNHWEFPDDYPIKKF